MNMRIIKTCLFIGLVVLAADAAAQRGGRRRPGAQPDTTNRPNQQQTQNNVTPPGYNAYANLPIVVDSTAGNDTVTRRSLRPDNAFDKSMLLERTPLAYEHLRWDDAFFAEKVWRELDLREKINMPFRFESQGDNGSQLFIDILLKAVRSGEVTAFEDDGFRIPKSLADVELSTASKWDTVPVADVNDPSKFTHLAVTKTVFDSRAVTRIAIKEEWVFDRESSRYFVRILGIAPLLTKFLPNGQELGRTVMFWVYYPDLRPTLARYEVYNPKNMGNARMTWEELFESRMFSSYIVKSTLDNPLNKRISAVIKDPILALLEGENIKDKIFNFEQNLWAY